MIPGNGNNKINAHHTEKLAEELCKHQRPDMPVADKVGVICLIKKHDNGIGYCDKVVISESHIIN